MITIHLPEELERFVHGEVERGRFSSQDEAIAEAVRLLQRPDRVQREGNEADPAPAETVPPWQRVLENMKDVPDSVFEQIPADSSEQLDHYLYGIQKRQKP